MSEVVVRRPNNSFRYGDVKPKVSFTYLIVGLASVVVGISAVTGIVYFATRKCEWINVHLVPHTHDDVGWLRTPEEYYDFTVKWILNHVVKELQKSPKRKFVYVETYFFWKWWSEQCDDTKKIVRQLVRNGQLEMIGGGWSMSDEAVVHYQSFIDQSTWGFRRLNDSFGSDVYLNMAWQIDTFGHSKELAALLAMMGFDALFFARIDIDDRSYRKSKKLMEFIWEGNKNLGVSSQIFTSIFYEHYSSPQGLNFETEPPEYDIDLNQFAAYAREHAEALRTNNILVPMGDDFRFFNAHNYFQKLDELIRGFNMNQDYKLNVFYSTPSQYIEALRQSEVYWPTFNGDFFPYASEKYTYWTGYYSSRPTLKYFERIANNFLQITKQLLVMANLGQRFFEELTTLREALGVLQHHDAITGTAKQYVTDHYAELLAQGIANCQRPVNKALKTLHGSNHNDAKLTFESCLMLNISECPVTTNSSNFIITVYNPLNRLVDRYVRVPVSKPDYTVREPNGEYVTTQIMVLSRTVLYIPGRESEAKFELLFKAPTLPPLGFKSFYISETVREHKIWRKSRKSKREKRDVQIGFDQRTGLISEITINGKCIALQQSIRYYTSHHWGGAYIFRSEEGYTHELEPGKIVQSTVLNDGELVTEYEQIFADWGSQIVRVYKDERYVEFEWLVGPIPTGDFKGKEVVLMYSSNINSGDLFYTDLNGRGMERRVRDYREWKRRVSEPVAGNYYPVTTQISIEDDSTQMHIMTDRPQGGTSLIKGRIELMVHRRLCFDDGKGVDEPLNEVAFEQGLVARGKHWLTFGDAKDSNFAEDVKLMAQEIHSTPWLFIANADLVPFHEWSSLSNQFSGLTHLTPPSIRLLTLEPWTDSTQLIRLEHIFGSSSLGNYSRYATVSLKYWFKNYIITEARETTLGANKWLSQKRKMNWFGGSRDFYPGVRNDFLDGDMTVAIEPEHIRTFIIKMEPIR